MGLYQLQGTAGESSSHCMSRGRGWSFGQQLFFSVAADKDKDKPHNLHRRQIFLRVRGVMRPRDEQDFMEKYW